jgi:hypothetical protein
MDKNKLQKIRKILRATHKVCKEFAVSDEAKGYDFYRSENLTCMCLCGSQVLKKVLKTHNIKGDIYQSNEHAWVMVDGYVVDVTRSQYENRQTLIKPYKDIDSLTEYEDGEVYKRIRINDWGKSQTFGYSMVNKLSKRVEKQLIRS